MSALKFECPACGQSLECERALSGDIIHCPRCCAELRIPFSNMAGTVLRAELIMHAQPAQKAPDAVRAVDAPPPATEPQAPSVPEVQEVICPVCESELRIRAGAPKPDGQARLAELIRKGEPKPPAPAPEPKQEEAHPEEHKALNPEERDRQIAAAREAHPVQANTPVKPRLSYVLSGKSPKEEEQEHKADESHPPFSE